ncbi:MAG: translation initiation factor IF-2 [Chitinophagales bacterium]|nr:translation initiation factor IF-2 [Chitinophagales bacterium]
MSVTKSIQLVKAASELNVGINTIIEYLASHGHQVENKPSTKLSPEQYDVLLSAFKQDIAIRKKADEINIGKVRKDKVDEVKDEKVTIKEEEKPVVVEKIEVKIREPKIVGKIDLDGNKKKPESEKVLEEKVIEVTEKVEPETKNEMVGETVEEVVTSEEKTTLKIVGKIDLEDKKKSKSKKTSPKTEEKKKEETPKIEEAPTPSEIVPAPVIQVKEQVVKEVKEEEHVIRAEAGKLEGVTVIGKIELPQRRSSDDSKKTHSKDNSKGEKKKRKRISGRAVNIDKVGTEGDDKNNVASSDRNRNRSQGQGQNQGDRRDKRRGDRNRKPVETDQTVSEKEIDDKIKATMAKLSGNKARSIKSKNKKSRRNTAVESVEATDGGKIQVTEFISVSELANILDISPTQVISACFSLGIIVSINQRIDAEVIELVAGEFGREVEFISITDEDEELDDVDEPEDLKPRAPIVTIMGHVDHGKTSLLDYIRNANIVAGEAGGITQHIGAYEVTLPESNKKVTFLDTPGHEAFTAMRARGAKLTDIVVVVVAADDNVMPQTKEAISHAQAADVPIIIAINKIDKPTANPDNIKKQLADMNIVVEEWGGKYQSQEISAKKGTGVNELLEKILLEAELLELKANPDKPASGSLLEASLDKGRGYISTIMVQEGTLKIGDFVVAGQYYGKVKALFNERGSRVSQVGPSQPVQLLGLNGAPTAGDKFKVYESEQEAKEIANKRTTIIREQGIRAQKHITLDEIGRRLALGNFKELNIIIKGDADGSIEALSDSLLKLSTEEIQVNIILKGVGAITENDVQLAIASDAVVVAFQVRPSTNAKQLAERESIEIRNYSIIYDAIEDVKHAMEGMLEPKFEEKVVAEVEVRETFKISKVGTIAGCYVMSGRISRSNEIRLVRDGIVVFTGELDSLKRIKDDVKEVGKGFECGIKVKNYNDIRIGDIIEAFEKVEIKRKL